MVLKAFASRQFLHFLCAGGTAAVVNFGVGWLLFGWLPLYGDVAVGYLAGMLTAFFLFEAKVFGEHKESRKKSVVMFLIVNVFGLSQTWLAFPLLKDYLFSLLDYQFYAAESARAIAIFIPMFSSFLGHKFFTFKQ